MSRFLNTPTKRPSSLTISPNDSSSDAPAGLPSHPLQQNPQMDNNDIPSINSPPYESMEVPSMACETDTLLLTQRIPVETPTPISNANHTGDDTSILN